MRKRPLTMGLVSLSALLEMSGATQSQALPVMPAPTSGMLSIIEPGAGMMEIRQTSQVAIVNWWDFRLGGGGRVDFVQPPASIGLHRVIGGGGLPLSSEISGSVTSNGTVALVNGQGVYFTSGASFAGGSLIAATFDIGDQDFIDANYRFQRHNPASVDIDSAAELEAASGGSITLMGAEVNNHGIIAALGGSINLVSAENVQLGIDASGLVSVVGAPTAAADAGIVNTGVLDATGGTLSLHAVAVTGGDILSYGAINAGLLTGRASGKAIFSEITDGESFGLNTITALGSFTTGGDFRLKNTQAISVVGSGVLSNGNVWLETATGGIDVDADISGADVGLRASGDLAINRTVTGTGISLAAAGNIIVDGTVNGPIAALQTRSLVVGSSAGHSSAQVRSALTIASGMTLGGYGTVGSTTVLADGLLSSGDSIGALRVQGDLVFESEADYQVEVSTGDTDHVVVTGTATLGGASVQLVNVPESHPVGTRHTILSAGVVTGTFGSLNLASPLTTPFLSFDLAYDPDAVHLDVSRSNVAFASAGQTPNQIVVGGDLDSLPPTSPLQNALVQLDIPGARTAFDLLSGDFHASIKGVMLEDSRFVREIALGRLRDAFSAVGAVRTPVTSYADGGSAAAPPTDHFTAWGHGFGAWGQWSGNDAAAIRRDIGGFLVGGDGLVADTWRVGVLGGYSRSSFYVDDRASSGSSADYHFGLYGGTQWGDLAFRTGAAYTWHDIATNRSVAFPGFADSLKGGYHARTAQAFGELGYGVQVERFGFEPFANLAYVNFEADGFGESGGPAALTVRESTTDVTFTTLGLRVSAGLTLDNGWNLTARGMLGWRHAFGDTTPFSTVAFAGGAPVTIAGMPIARDAAVVEAGFDLALTPSATLALSYDGQFGSGRGDQSIRGIFAVEF